jgi:biopolymer transport protein ExbB/TolQ
MPPFAVNLNNLDWGGKGFAYALDQSHLPGLVITGTLLLLSVISWSVMFSKLFMVGQAARRNYRFMNGFRQARSVLEPYDRNVTIPGSPLFGIYRAACRELTVHLAGVLDPDEARRLRIPDASKVTPAQLDAVRNAMDRAIGEAVVILENRMAFLATAVSGAPFLGLLGTVWGVMETFGGVAASGSSASIQSMAPGVAAALVTTVVGLLVAIPAMFGYNFIVSRIRIQILEMHNFAAELTSYFEREFVDFGPATVILDGTVPAPIPAAAAARRDPAYPEPAYRDHPFSGISYGEPAEADPEPARNPGPLVPAASAGPRPAVPLQPAPPLDSFFPSRPAPASRPPDGPPINPIARQAAARRPTEPGPGPDRR